MRKKINLSGKIRAIFIGVIYFKNIKTFKYFGKNSYVNSHKYSNFGRRARVYDNVNIDIYPLPVKEQYLKVGDDFTINRNSEIITHGGFIEIHDNVFIGPNCQIQAKGGITIHDNVMIANGTVIVSSDHDISDIPNGSLKNEIGKSIVIESNVWIGANCIITKGVTICANTVVAAGSVVTKDLLPNCIYAGNPAKLLKAIND